MNVKVLFFASCRDIVDRREMDVAAPEGATAADVLNRLCGTYPRLSDLRGRMALSVNENYVAPETVLKPGDTLALIPPVSGGSDTIPQAPAKEDIYRITEEPIRPDALFDHVRSDEDGAVVTFAGVVRDNSLGRETEHLVYDAYREMAEKKLREVGAEIRAKWGLERVAILHRVGRMEIGEISVLIAVASPHRREAFEACHYAIDRLKQTVPIWKKEVWTDGETWIEGARPVNDR